ncbi:MAG: DUF378 domain-containing protein [Candidatus Andersenbacteria bacterium]|nr:DUF378 domain-containing protein [Candidatus Andersenbacteria bacterium]MBI3250399.1 DUF378 domain-containing protein [Candidatus Andersenbacteria bacterium]
MNKGLHVVAFALVIIGGLNWLAVGLFGWDIGQIFGGMEAMASRVIYVLVGVAAVYLAATHKNDCRACGGSSMGGGNMMNK